MKQQNSAHSSPILSRDINDQECLGVAMLLGYEWKRFTLVDGGYWNTNDNRLSGRRFAPTPEEGARYWLIERGYLEK